MIKYWPCELFLYLNRQGLKIKAGGGRGSLLHMRIDAIRGTYRMYIKAVILDGRYPDAMYVIEIIKMTNP